MWQSHQLDLYDVTLGWEEAGTGDPLVFLAGGPGDAVAYLRPVAAPFISAYRCVLLDQRGCGTSILKQGGDAALSLERFYEDIEAVRIALGVDQISLVGHSWGAMLAVYFGMRHPHRVKRMILLGMGPLDAEASAVAGANILKSLTLAERAELEHLSQMRRTAVEQGQWELAKHYHIKSVRMRSRALYFNLDVAAQAMDAWEREYALNPVMHRVVNQQAKQIQVWGNLGHITAPTLVVYGYQDFEPITQAYRLKEEMLNVTIRLVNEAGHEVWLEQAEWLEEQIWAFLGKE